MYQNLARNFESVLKHREGLSLCFRRCRNSIVTGSGDSGTSVTGVRPMVLYVRRPFANIATVATASKVSNTTTTTTSRSRTITSTSRVSNAIISRKVRPSCCICATSNEVTAKKDELNLGHMKGQVVQTYGYTLFGLDIDKQWNRNLPWNYIASRDFHSGFVNYCAKPGGSTSEGDIQTEKKTDDHSKAGTATGDATSTANMRVIAPSNFDKKILVWTGKYPSLEAVPNLVTDSTLNWAKNKFRVYVNIAMAASTFCIALVVMAVGRRRAERGESVSKLNMMRHPMQYQHKETSATSSK